MDVQYIPRTEVPEWEDRFPWLVAGTTGRRVGQEEPNFGLFGALPAASVMTAWTGILSDLGPVAAVHCQQVHGSDVHVHQTPQKGLRIAPPGDGHATRAPGLLLTVAIADCVPVFMVSPEGRVIGLLHAGWRGAAAGILQAGVATLKSRLQTNPEDLHVHFGPAICGECYEVGTEVFRALGVEPSKRLDLRAVLVEQAKTLGVPSGHISVSDACTKCSAGAFFSHRGGDQGRQIAYMALRDNF